MGKEIHHVLVKEAAFTVQSSGTAAATNDPGLRPDADLHPSPFFLIFLDSFNGVHGHLLFVWSCCRALTLKSNESAIIFRTTIVFITY